MRRFFGPKRTVFLERGPDVGVGGADAGACEEAGPWVGAQSHIFNSEASGRTAARVSGSVLSLVWFSGP